MTGSSAPHKPTIYDIAKAASASAATVSMVMNGSWKRYRIKEETAQRILDTANQLGYHVNMKARGLRLSRSGLAGMILPHYRNRFFAGLAEGFEAQARARGLCPIVVSTQREPALERDVTQTLLSQRVELLFITGVQYPAPLNALCRAAGIPAINVDLPGVDAPSVVSDNHGGARTLTGRVIERLQQAGRDAQDLYFLGGVADEYATDLRVAGFLDALTQRGLRAPPNAVERCGYRPAMVRLALRRWVEQRGTLPAGLFINSITALEGLAQFASEWPRDSLRDLVVGCFDWDPFAVLQPFDVVMMRQNVERLIAEAFALVDSFDAEAHPLVMVPTDIHRFLDEDAVSAPAAVPLTQA